MLSALFTAASGMTAQQAAIDIVANNLANVNTTGYKGSSARFQDLLYTTLQRPVVTGANPPQIGQGVRAAAAEPQLQQGTLQQTDSPLDLALSGEGWFTVSPDAAGNQRYYTRDGSLHEDAQRYLVTAQGYYLLGDDGNRIRIPAGASQIAVSPDGDLSCTVNGQPVAITRLGIVQFTNPPGLEKAGHNLYQASADSGQIVQSEATVEQYHLEASNVQVGDELVNLITAQRAYELDSRAVQTADEMLQIVNNLRR
jgi:flagellar basal-body rod protein FlgG